MDGIRIITLSRVLADACLDSPTTTAHLAAWITDSEVAGARTAAEIRQIGKNTIRHLCHPEEPLADCPATIFDDPEYWCAGCTVGNLRSAVEQFHERKKK